jgi:hypothetical protein
MQGLFQPSDSVKLNRLNVIRIFGVSLLLAGAAIAQNPSGPGTLAAPEQAAKQKTAEWDALERALDSSIRQLLPCDPKAAAAIAEVSRASEARVAALTAYLEAAGRQTTLQTAGARRVLASIQPLESDLAAEKSDLAREQSGTNGQIAILTDSGQRRPAFNAVQDALRQIAALEQQRSDAADSAVSHADPAAGAVRTLLDQLEAHDAALKEARSAFEAEGSRWSAYYAARSARTQTECSVTRGFVAAPAQAPARPQPAPQGKQK